MKANSSLSMSPDKSREQQGLPEASDTVDPCKLGQKGTKSSHRRQEKNYSKSFQKDDFLQENRDKTIFVGGITCRTNQQEMISIFSRFGSVLRVKLIKNKKGEVKGYCFVTFQN